MKLVCYCHAACPIDNRLHYEDPNRDKYADSHHTVAHVHEDGRMHFDDHATPYNLRRDW